MKESIEKIKEGAVEVLIDKEKEILNLKLKIEKYEALQTDKMICKNIEFFFKKSLIFVFIYKKSEKFDIFPEK